MLSWSLEKLFLNSNFLVTSVIVLVRIKAVVSLNLEFKQIFNTWRWFRVWHQECNYVAQHNRKKKEKEKADTHPNQRILGVTNGSEGAEVEDQYELCIFQR